MAGTNRCRGAGSCGRLVTWNDVEQVSESAVGCDLPGEVLPSARFAVERGSIGRERPIGCLEGNRIGLGSDVDRGGERLQPGLGLLGNGCARGGIAVQEEVEEA